MDITLFRNRIFADDQGKMRSLEWALIQYDCIHIKWGSLDTEFDTHTKRKPYEESRD